MLKAVILGHFISGFIIGVIFEIVDFKRKKYLTLEDIFTPFASAFIGYLALLAGFIALCTIGLEIFNRKWNEVKNKPVIKIKGEEK